ncbi:MAG: T9SS type A sorting domain-containing protein [Bacteroidia bacterium]|nr:T9SS type A sorting domain-containing protein [Bacteroidia bacterium]
MNKFYTAIVALAGLYFLSGSAQAQQTILVSQGGTVNSCSANFYDSGGSGSTYSANEDYTVTICGDGSATPMYAIFSAFNLESNYDYLYIYDGSSTSATLVGQYTGSTSPGTVTSTSGCLTFRFTSDGSVQNAGFTATIGCGAIVVPPGPSTTCAGAGGACLSSAITFPAGTSGGTAETGPNYGCLSTRPNPAWYYFQVGTSGSIAIDQSNSSGIDVDGAIWGPFSDPSTGCSSLSGLAPIACDYAASATFSLTIPNAQAGEYYLILITNYNGGATNITFSQNPSSTGSTTCNALCNISAFTGSGASCTAGTNTYNVTGTITFTDPPSTGTLTFSDGANQTVINAPFTSPYNFTITGVTADGASHTVNAVFSGSSACNAQFTYTAPTPASTSVTGTTTICQGASTTLSAGAGFTSYAWTGPNGFTATTQSITATAAGTYTVGATNSGGCTGTASATVTVNAGPTPTITGNLNVCNGSSTTLDGGAGFSTYAWTGPSGFTASTQTITATAAGTYNLTVTDANGCQGSSSATVVSGSVTVNITGTTTICQGTTTTLDAGAGYSTYAWTGPNGFTDANQTVTVGSGAYTVNVVDAFGCTGTGSVTVTETVVNVTVTGNLTVCPGATTVLDAGPGYTSYGWTDALPIPVPPYSTTQTATLGAGTYAVTVTDANGCVGSALVAVIENDTVPITITGTTAICSGGSTVLDAGAGSNYIWAVITTGITILPGETNQTYTATQPGIYGAQVDLASGCIGIDTITVVQLPSPSPTITGSLTYCTTGTTLDAGAGFATYSWSDGGSFSGSTQTVTAPAGTYTVTVTDNNGCSGTSAPVTVTQSSQVTFAITGNTVLCPGGSVTLDAGTGYTTYQWGTAVGTTPTPIPGETNQTFTTSTPGIYGVQVVNSSGCSGIDTIIVTQGTAPVPTITGSLTYCPSAPGTTLDAGAGFTSYSWTPNGETTQTITAANGSYTVTVTDANGCTGTSASVTVTQSSTITPVVTGTLQYCQGGNTTLDAGTGYTQYVWTDLSNNNIIGTNQTVVVTQGQYSVGVSQAGCSGSSAPVTVTEVAIPTVTAVAQGSTQVCQGQSVTLTASGASTYTWSPGNQTGASISVSTSGSYTVYGEAIPGCGATSAPVTVTILSNPSVSAVANGPTQFCNGSVVLAASGASTYVWNPGGATTPTITVTQSGSYTVTGTDANGCSATSGAITIQSGSTLQINIISSTGGSVVCSGQPVVLDGTTVGAASYSWSPGGATSPTLTVTSSGTYSLTVTDPAGCVATSSPYSVTVGTTPVPTVTSSTNSSLLCNVGDQITYTVVGTYTAYQWSTSPSDITNSVTITQPGTYVVTVTNSDGCVGSSQPIYVSLSPSSLTIVPDGPVIFCEGTGSENEVGLDATSGFDYYVWTSGSTTEDIITNVSGSYFVTAYNDCYPYDPTLPNNGGITSNTINVTVITSVDPYIVSFDDTLQAMPAAISYQWYFNGTIIPGAFNQQYVATQTGAYTVVTQDSSGCGFDTSLVFNFVLKPNTIGIEELNGVTDLNMYPNPASSSFFIEATLAPSTKVEVTFADMLGKSVVNPVMLDGTGLVVRKVDFSELSRGIYFVTIKVNEASITKRIVKE